MPFNTILAGASEVLAIMITVRFGLLKPITLTGLEKSLPNPVSKAGSSDLKARTLKVPSGAVCTLALSFNNKGPIGTFFRYICDNGTYIARYDDLVDGDQQPVDLSKVDVSMNGIELQDREFFAAIREGREPNSSVAQVLPCYQVLHDLEQQLNA